MLELEYKKMVNDRDFKLKLILIKDFDNVNKYFTLSFDEYKSEINRLALNRLVVNLENLGSRIGIFMDEMNSIFNENELPKIKL